MGIKIYGDQPIAIAGQKEGLNDETETLLAGEKLLPGDPVFGMVGESKVGYGAHVNAVSLTANKDLATGDSAVATVNGIVLDPVVFTESSEKTIKAIVQAIDLNDEIRALGIDAFTVDGNPRVIYLSAPGITITATVVVSGSGTPATFASASYTSAKFMGVARYQELCFREGTGFYPPQTSVSVQTFGKVYVPVADSATPVDKEKAYVVLSGADAGKFTDDSSGYDCGAYFRSNRVEGNLALIELRGLK